MQPHPSRSLQAPLALIIGLFASSLLLSCAERVVVCPDGYFAKGDFCYPNPQPVSNDAGGVDAGGAKDAGQDIAKDVGAKDTGNAPLDSGSSTDTGSPKDAGSSQDAGPEDTGPIKPKSPVGAACTDDFDCLSGLTCFNWPKGYCTELNCLTPGTTCPGSAVCWGVSKATHICDADCDQNSDCRVKDGYGCKRLTADFGGIDARLCLPSGTQAPGKTCKTPLDCSGSSTCLIGETGIEGGYCARIGCGKNDPCEPGTACVLRGKPTCLKTCNSDADCAVSGNHTRKCVTRSDMSKQPVKICLDSAKAAAVGEKCNTDLDCNSKSCTVVSKGSCKSGTNAPCSVDADCGASGPCEISQDKEIGVCTQPCSNKEGCPIGSICVPGSSDLVGSCQPTCKGPGELETCANVPHMVCTFGQPISPPGEISVLAYACAPTVKGKAGAACTKSSDCDSYKCSTNVQGTAGFCLAPCDTDDPPCPFGTVCFAGGISSCEKLCALNYDCPTQMVCGNSGQPSYKTCQIP